MTVFANISGCMTALALVFSAGASAAAAQEAASAGAAARAEPTLEEIVVTAQKRRESLQSTPIAITAVTGESIARKGLADIQQVAQFAPNIKFEFTAPVSGASNAASVFIRGIGQSDFELTTEAGVGTYVDGVYVSRSLGGVMDVLDVERIEILRGPQGTLFGRNTIGGAISIISKAPSQDFGGSVEATLGDAGRRWLRGSVNLPLDPTTAVRLSVSSKDRNGFIRSAYPAAPNNPGYDGLKDLGNENRQAARLVLAHEFSPALKATLSADIGRIRENNAGDRLVGITSGPNDGPIAFAYNTFGAPGRTLPGFANASYSEANFNTGNDTTYSTGPNGTRLDSVGTALTLEYAVADSLTIKSISAYRRTKGSFNRDADGSPIALTETQNYHYRHRQFSQELQFVGDLFDKKLEYAAGLYFFRETGSDPVTVALTDVVATLYEDQLDIRNKSYAAFLQAKYKVTDRLNVTLGGRYTHDKKHLDIDMYLLAGSAAPILFGVPQGTILPLIPRNSSLSVDFNNFSPRVSVDYKLDNLLLYGSWSKGFKSGGFNSRYVAPRPAVLPFAPEKAETFEAGFKFEGLQRRVRLNVAAFTTSYKDIQVTVFESLGAPVALNAGDARIKGAEAELTVAPVRGLDFTANLGYLDAYYTRVRANPALVSTPEQIIDTDTRLPKTPHWQGSIGASYTYELDSSAKLDARADMTFSSRYANDAQNSRYLNQKSYQLVSASIGYTAPNARWTLRGFVDNLTNKRYIVSGDSNFGIGFHEANFNRPREFGGSLTYRF